MMFTRVALAVLALACSSAAQVVSFAGASTTFTQDGIQKLITPQGVWRCDAALHGDELVIMNGAVEQYYASVSGIYKVEQAGLPPIVGTATLFDATGIVVRLNTPTEILVRESDNPYFQTYLAGGPGTGDPVASDSSFLMGVAQSINAGPNPDVSDAGQGGSARVVWDKWEMGVVMLLLGRQEIPAPQNCVDEMVRWTESQWLRGYHYYWGNEGHRKWESWDDPDAIVGKGYRAPGGFWPTYGHTELHGRTSLSGGWNPPDEQHCTGEKLIFTALAMDSWAARRSAESLLECRASFPGFGTKIAKHTGGSSIRAAGWVARLYAHMLGAFPAGNEHVRDLYLPGLQASLDLTRGHLGPGTGQWWTHLTSSKGDHLHPSPALTAAVNLLLPGVDPNDLCRHQSIWQTSIWGLSCLEVLKYAKPKDPWWTAEAIRTGLFVFRHATRPSYSIDDLTLVLPRIRNPSPGAPQVNVVSDYGPEYRLHNRPSHNAIVGVSRAAIVPFMEAVTNYFPPAGPEAIRLADQIIDYCNYNKWWGSKPSTKTMLGSWFRTWGRRGWQG